MYYSPFTGKKDEAQENKDWPKANQIQWRYVNEKCPMRGQI